MSECQDRMAPERVEALKRELNIEWRPDPDDPDWQEYKRQLIKTLPLPTRHQPIHDPSSHLRLSVTDHQGRRLFV